MKPINLNNANLSGCCGATPVKAQESYPTLYLSFKEEVEIPKSGTMTVTFTRKEKTERENEEGETYSCILDIKAITALSGDKEASPPARSFDKETKDALASLRKEKMSEGAEESDDGEDE